MTSKRIIGPGEGSDHKTKSKKVDHVQPKTNKPAAKHVARDAKTGQFISPRTGHSRPSTTVVEAIRVASRTRVAERPPAGGIEEFLTRFNAREDIKDIMEDWAK